MRILFVGDYSNLHACLATELRRRGHDATVVSDGGGYQLTDCDFRLRREPGLRGSFRYLRDIFDLLPRLSGYDIVQLINPHFLKLRPGKLRYLFSALKRQNGAVCLTLAGNDHFFVRACTRSYIFPYSEFRVGSEPTPFAMECPERERGYMRPDVELYTRWIYDSVDGAMSALYEYDLAARPELGERLTYTGIPIDTTTLSPSPLPTGKQKIILVGTRPGMSTQKGTGILAHAARCIEAETRGEWRLVEAGGLPLREYMNLVRRSHIVLDQMYALSPATNALGAMACGRLAASGGAEAYYDFIGEKQLRPVVAVSPQSDPFDALLPVLTSPAEMERRAAEGRKLVVRHNDAGIVARRFVDAWTAILDKK